MRAKRGRLPTELLGVHRVVTKEREFFLAGSVRIHLDRVERLGSFLALEAVFDGDPGSEPAQPRKVEQWMGALEIRERDLGAGSAEAMVAPLPVGRLHTSP